MVPNLKKNITQPHGLRTPYEALNQRNLKNWVNVADQICFGRTYKFGFGIEFLAVQWKDISSLGFNSRCLTLFQLGRDNFYHLKSISRDKAVLE